MRESKLRTMFANGQAAVNGWCAIPSSVSAEGLARAGFDSVTVDLQHGLVDYTNALPMLQAISQTEATPLCRVPWLEPGIIMKCLDAGAYGVICPMVNTAQDAEDFVAACNYAPRGKRSFGPTRALMYAGGDYAANANATMLSLAMIETTTALSNMDAIMATDGLSGIYIGPSDLALSMGYQPKLDHDEPKVVEAIKSILACARKHKLFAGIHCLNPGYARDMIDLGFNLVTLGSDMRLMSSAASDGLAHIRQTAKATDTSAVY